MYLIPIPAFDDNYLWLLHDGKRALVVDPGDAGPVQRTLEQHALQLESILVTHHHADHTGGVAALREAWGATVYGPATESIPRPYTPLKGGESLTALGLDFQVIDVPGHTAGHIAFYTPGVNDRPLLFCGDTLFSGGCGRLFEGTPAQMLASLEKLAGMANWILNAHGANGSHEPSRENPLAPASVVPSIRTVSSSAVYWE
jgi:hydroxyacylglutathione hydrolase